MQGLKPEPAQHEQRPAEDGRTPQGERRSRTPRSDRAGGRGPGVREGRGGATGNPETHAASLRRVADDDDEDEQRRNDNAPSE